MAEPGPASGGIFISYRRQETEWAAAWLDDQLVAKFGRQRVFKDVDSIGPGEKFEETIGLALSSCTVLLALIGEGWLTATAGSGRPRLLDPDDLVRREIETALERNILVIPVLVSGASLPTEEELPPTLVSLPARQAQELNSGSFAHGAGRLIDAVERALRATGAGTATTEAAPPRSMPSEFDIAQAIWRGMDGVSEAIRRTLGPRERSVVIPQADGKPLLTSDARTIAAGLRFDDPQEAVGADLVGTLVSRMEDLAGGGAGTAVVLAQAMATEVLRQRLSGSSPMAMQRGINRGVELAVQSIRDQARYFESRDQLAHAASVAPATPRSVSSSPRRWTSSARKAWSPSGGRTRPAWSWSPWRACGSTGATSRTTSSPTPCAMRRCWRTRTS